MRFLSPPLFKPKPQGRTNRQVSVRMPESNRNQLRKRQSAPRLNFLRRGRNKLHVAPPPFLLTLHFQLARFTLFSMKASFKDNRYKRTELQTGSDLTDENKPK
jgi:hypothetical protein